MVPFHTSVIGESRPRVGGSVIAESVPTVKSINEVDWRDAVLVLVVGSGVLLVVVTEGLSFFGALTPPALRLVWGGWLGCIGLLALARKKVLRATWRAVTCLTPVEQSVLAGLAAIVVLTGVTAWFAPPNTSDSLTYHMSRVANWAQHQSVAHYATPTARQLFQPPLAEFAILQLQLIAGSDRFANFVQWSSMVGCLMTTSRITGLLGGSGRTQILSAVFVGSLPMGVVQASSTQNDYVVALWLSAFALSVVLIWRETDAPDWRHYVLSGVCVGLAMCTKGTSYFFAGPFVAVLVGVHVWRWQLTRLPVLLLPVLTAMLVNLGPFVRNQQLYGFPLGAVREEGGAGYQVSALLWNGVVSNIVRNFGMHLGTPIGPVNDAIFDDISYLHEKLGIWLGSAVTSWPGSVFERSVVVPSVHESTAGNLLALVLLASSVVLGVSAGIFRRDRRLSAYTAAWASGFVLFSAILRWHPWETRLDLPWFVLGAPVMAIVLSRRPEPRAWLSLPLVLLACCVPLIVQRAQGIGAPERLRDAALALLTVLVMWLAFRRKSIPRSATFRGFDRAAWASLNVVLLLAAIPWVLLNQPRPLLGPQSVLTAPRENQYFVTLPELQAPYAWAAAQATATGCQYVGLLIREEWDYPLWMLLGRGRTPSPVNVQYLDVTGPAARLAGSSPPCAIIATHGLDQPTLYTRGQHYSRVDSQDVRGIAVFLAD